VTATPSTSIATRRIELVPPQATPGGTFSAVWAIDVEVEVDGSTGHGMARAFSDDMAHDVAQEIARLCADDRVQAALADSLVTAGRLDRWRTTWDLLERDAEPGASFLALAALDEAMWGLPRTEGGRPVNDRRDTPSVGVYWSGLWLHSSLDELAAETRWAAAQGFHGAKLRLDGQAIGASIDRARMTLDAAPVGRWLALEFAGSGTSSAIEEIVSALDASRLLWVEDPLPAAHVEETAALVDRVAVPIATGEDCWGRAALAERVAATGIAMPILDLGFVGGPSAMLEILERGAFGRRQIGVHIDALSGADAAAVGPRVSHLWLEAFAWWGAPSVDEVLRRAGR
jgi:L-alanine-DL-glutamate epimerase-like enolase superfamily enzyme